MQEQDAWHSKQPVYLRLAEDETRTPQGVFTRRGFKQGEVVAYMPVIVNPVEDYDDLLKLAPYDKYSLPWNPDTEPKRLCVPMDYFPFYKRDLVSPSLTMHQIKQDESFILVAARDILPGEELTISGRVDGQPEKDPSRKMVSTSQDSLWPAIEIRPSKYGRGVFASRDIAQGELFEIVPVLLTPCVNALEETMYMGNYVYGWVPFETITATPFSSGLFFNHSYSPNARYFKDFKALTIRYVALKEIKAGEEVYVNYNGDPDCKDPLWFPTY